MLSIPFDLLYLAGLLAGIPLMCLGVIAHNIYYFGAGVIVFVAPILYSKIELEISFFKRAQPITLKAYLLNKARDFVEPENLKNVACVVVLMGGWMWGWWWLHQTHSNKDTAQIMFPILFVVCMIYATIEDFKGKTRKQQIALILRYFTYALLLVPPALGLWGDFTLHTRNTPHFIANYMLFSVGCLVSFSLAVSVFRLFSIKALFKKLGGQRESQ